MNSKLERKSRDRQEKEKRTESSSLLVTSQRKKIREVNDHQEKKKQPKPHSLLISSQKKRRMEINDQQEKNQQIESHSSISFSHKKRKSEINDVRSGNENSKGDSSSKIREPNSIERRLLLFIDDQQGILYNQHIDTFIKVLERMVPKRSTLKEKDKNSTEFTPVSDSSKALYLFVILKTLKQNLMSKDKGVDCLGDVKSDKSSKCETVSSSKLLSENEEVTATYNRKESSDKTNYDDESLSTLKRFFEPIINILGTWLIYEVTKEDLSSMCIDIIDLILKILFAYHSLFSIQDVERYKLHDSIKVTEIPSTVAKIRFYLSSSPFSSLHTPSSDTSKLMRDMEVLDFIPQLFERWEIECPDIGKKEFEDFRYEVEHWNNPSVEQLNSVQDKQMKNSETGNKVIQNKKEGKLIHNQCHDISRSNASFSSSSSYVLNRPNPSVSSSSLQLNSIQELTKFLSSQVPANLVALFDKKPHLLAPAMKGNRFNFEIATNLVERYSKELPEHNGLFMADNSK